MSGPSGWHGHKNDVRWGGMPGTRLLCLVMTASIIDVSLDLGLGCIVLERIGLEIERRVGAGCAVSYIES